MTGGRAVPGPQPPVPDRQSSGGSADHPGADRDVPPGLTHPGWCDPAVCTAVAASGVLDSWLAGGGGQHRSAPIPVDLTGAIRLPQQTGTAYLTAAAAPWQRRPYRHLQLGSAELCLPTEAAGPVLAALSGLVASTRCGAAVIR